MARVALKMKPIVNKKYRLEKFHGKGGWTFVRLPASINVNKAQFGWTKVKEAIDDFEIRKYYLMPMADGKLFLPVKAEIRKRIKKEEGDLVHITLYPDQEPLEVPEEMLLCLQDEPAAIAFFKTLSESEQKFYVQWIYSAKKEDTKVDRIAKTVNKLAKGLKLYTRELNNE